MEKKNTEDGGYGHDGTNDPCMMPHWKKIKKQTQEIKGIIEGMKKGTWTVL